MKKHRIAIINHDKCQPKKCNQECKRICPINRVGKECVVVDIENVAKISEELCIGCGQCVKVCPFNAIQIINLPSEAMGNVIYKYGENKFQLHNLPIVRPNHILGIIGSNGIGKSTLINILSGSIVPNFGNIGNISWVKNQGFISLETDQDRVDKQIETLKYFRGKEIQKYFKRLYDGNMKIAYKPQQLKEYYDNIENKDQTVEEFLCSNCEVDQEFYDKIIYKLELHTLLNSKIDKLSGGEKQRVLCAYILVKDADVYIFDEPSNFLDVRQRINIAELIQDLKCEDREKYIVVVEHDVTLLDYITDYICILYGVPGAYGIVSQPSSTAKAINNYFRGYIPGENVRFRANSIQYKLTCDEVEEEKKENISTTNYPSMKVTYPDSIFELNINSGSIKLGYPQLMIILGANGTGKTSFLTQLAERMELKLSLKPQHLGFKNKYGNISVMEFLSRFLGSKLGDELFRSDVIMPLSVNKLYDFKIKQLSGGEMQRVAIVLSLGKNANIYLLDEPSAGLDVEQRSQLLKVIERFAYHQNKICFVVEHDALIATSLASLPISKTIIFEKQIDTIEQRLCSATEPLSFNDGMNKFLEQMKITFRVDRDGKRPRINKLGASKDREQKKNGVFFETN